MTILKIQLKKLSTILKCFITSIDMQFTHLSIIKLLVGKMLGKLNWFL